MSEQLDHYLTAVQFTSADMAPAMPHSSCPWKQKSIVYSLQLVWLVWQYDATEIQHNQINYII